MTENLVLIIIESILSTVGYAFLFGFIIGIVLYVYIQGE